MEFNSERDRSWIISPVDEQILLHPEALCASVAVEAVVGTPVLGLGLVCVALSLRELGQLVLGGAEGPRLFADTRRVDHEAVLKMARTGGGGGGETSLQYVQEENDVGRKFDFFKCIQIFVLLSFVPFYRHKYLNTSFLFSLCNSRSEMIKKRESEMHVLKQTDHRIRIHIV